VSIFRRDADERGTPFVEVDSIVRDYINSQTNSCVQTMFRRYVKSDGDLVALFPFRALEHSFVISGRRSDRDRELRSNQIVRDMLIGVRRAVQALINPSNPRAVRLGEHYIQALNAQLEDCDRAAMFFLSMSEHPGQ
jgi:hypothetical protein